MISGTEKVVAGDLVYCDDEDRKAASKDIASCLDSIQVVGANEVVDDLDSPDADDTSEDIRNVKV